MSDERPIYVTVYGEDERPLRSMFIHPTQTCTEFGVKDPERVVVDGEVLYRYQPVLVSKIVVMLPERQP